MWIGCKSRVRLYFCSKGNDQGTGRAGYYHLKCCKYMIHPLSFPSLSFLLEQTKLINQGLYTIFKLLGYLCSYSRRLAKKLCYECGGSIYFDERSALYFSGKSGGRSVHHDELYCGGHHWREFVSFSSFFFIAFHRESRTNDIDIGSVPYSVTKAAQLHLMKCLAATQGPKVRVNAVLPGLLLTEWVRHTHLSFSFPPKKANGSRKESMATSTVL